MNVYEEKRLQIAKNTKLNSYFEVITCLGNDKRDLSKCFPLQCSNYHVCLEVKAISSKILREEIGWNKKDN